MLDETALMQMVQRGNLAAFNQLVLAYQGRAYNVAYRLLGDADQAADATQEAFIKAYTARNQFHGGSSQAWLMRIVTNTCLDYLRKQQRHPNDSLDEISEEQASFQGLLSPEEEPESLALRLELHQDLQTAINRLPADQRIALVLAHVEGMSYQEIAEVTRSSLGTVKSRISRARIRLRELLESSEMPEQPTNPRPRRMRAPQISASLFL